MQKGVERNRAAIEVVQQAAMPLLGATVVACGTYAHRVHRKSNAKEWGLVYRAHVWIRFLPQITSHEIGPGILASTEILINTIYTTNQQHPQTLQGPIKAPKKVKRKYKSNRH